MTNYNQSNLEWLDSSGEEVVVLETDHVLVLGVAGGDLFDVPEQSDRHLLVGFLGLSSLPKPSGKAVNQSR